MSKEFVSIFRKAQELTAKTRRATQEHCIIQNKPAQNKKEGEGNKKVNYNEIHKSLYNLSPSLANSYAQVKRDLQDTERLSWAGPAHELREVLRGILEILAPDDEVISQPEWKLEKDAKRPTQKQKAIFILRRRGAGSKEEEVLKQINFIEELVGNLVRSVYSRASNAAHGVKDRREVVRLLNYFEAFAHDLLDLD